jgi:hypothetical protein
MRGDGMLDDGVGGIVVWRIVVQRNPGGDLPRRY